MTALITLDITLKNGEHRSGTYTIYEALARLQEAARKEDFEDFRFREAE